MRAGGPGLHSVHSPSVSICVYLWFLLSASSHTGKLASLRLNLYHEPRIEAGGRLVNI
ncbi:MAG: hypothetical protein K0Q72_3216, partial [Armatimonadetes bacterium]|nr:hypothetical protein [Armatimonadota bacterium]